MDYGCYLTALEDKFLNIVMLFAKRVHNAVEAKHLHHIFGYFWLDSSFCSE